jgi:glycosyltransferase involved in cell wall biosynthesis
MRIKILYISYDGIHEPLGQSQVLAYLNKLAVEFDVFLLSFEKPSDLADTARDEAMQRRIRSAGISWTRLRYHRRPVVPATAFDISVGIAWAMYLMARHRIDIIHARSYVASVVAITVKAVSGAKFIFDMRGFWPDERVDGELWTKRSAKYAMAKVFERQFFRSADAVVSLTKAAVPFLEQFTRQRSRPPPIHVIPTCVDLKLFRRQSGLQSDQFVFGYVGSVSTWYLLDEVLNCFTVLQSVRPDAKLLIANRNQHDFIRERLAAHKIRSVELVTAHHAEMPAIISRMSVGVAMIKPLFSKIASAPTKVGEYLACGVPCLANEGVGDTAAILEDEGVGVALKRFDEEGRRSAIERLIALTQVPKLGAKCVEVAERHFSLDAGVDAYSSLYKALAPAGCPRES